MKCVAGKSGAGNSFSALPCMELLLAWLVGWQPDLALSLQDPWQDCPLWLAVTDGEQWQDERMRSAL